MCVSVGTTLRTWNKHSKQGFLSVPFLSCLGEHCLPLSGSSTNLTKSLEHFSTSYLEASMLHALLLTSVCARALKECRPLSKPVLSVGSGTLLDVGDCWRQMG